MLSAVYFHGQAEELDEALGVFLVVVRAFLEGGELDVVKRIGRFPRSDDAVRAGRPAHRRSGRGPGPRHGRGSAARIAV